MRLALVGDGDSPHLLKWAQALAPLTELWALSSRGFLPGFDDLVSPARRLALATQPRFAGGNLTLLRQLPRVARWLKQVQPDVVHAHYLTSHGSLAWLAMGLLGAPGQLVGSAWGSDILVTPDKNAAWRWLTRRVLQACALTTSDSQHMAQRMRALGAGEVMVFPFGLNQAPPPPQPARKEPRLFFANRGLEPIYAPERVLQAFAAVAGFWPDAQLLVANDGSMRVALQRQAEAAGLGQRVQWLGRLSATAQDDCYARAQWYFSLPLSDSVSVSVLEAMGHGCIPLLSDLPANHELVQSGVNGLVLPAGALPEHQALAALAARAEEIGMHNHRWVSEHGLFAPGVARFMARLSELQDASASPRAKPA